LWKSFLVGQGGSILFGILLTILIPILVVDTLGMSFMAAAVVGWVIFLLFYLMIVISLWKCAYNVDQAIWGHLARVYAVASFLFLVAVAISAIGDSAA